MSITPGTIAVTPGSGKILDTAEVVVGANTVEREVVCVGSPSTPAYYAEVTAANAQYVAPGQANALPPSFVEGTQGPISTDLQGNLRVLSSGVPTVLQKATFSTSGTPGSLACAFPNNVRVGSLLIAVVSVGGTVTPTIADTLTNNFVSAGTFSSFSGGCAIGAFYARSLSAGANTITVTIASESIAVQIYEVAGLAPGVVPDVYATTNTVSTTTTPINLGGSTTVSNDFAILAIAAGTGTTTITLPNAGSIFSGFLANDSGTVNPTTPTGLYSFACGSGILGAQYAAPTNSSITFGTARPYTSLFLCFKPYTQSSSSAITLTNQTLGVITSVVSVTTVQASKTVGNTGAVMDSASGAAPATTPANALSMAVSNLTTAPTLATGQSIAAQGDWGGALFVKPHRRSLTKPQATTIASTGSPATVVSAPASGVFADISGLVITPTAGSTGTAFTATLSDGTNSYIFDLNTGSTTSLVIQPPLAINFDPPLAATTAATAWTITLSSSSVTVHVTVNVVLQKAS